MKRFIEFIRMLALSPEILALLFIAGLFNYFPSLFSWVGTKLSDRGEPIKFLSLIPVVILGLIIRGRKDLLFPDHPAGEILEDWPQYYLILDRYWASIVICAVCGTASIAIWVLNFPLTEPKYSAIFLACVLIPMITYIFFHNATIKVRRILSKYKINK